MRRFFVCLITVAFLFLVVNGTALSTEYIINGGFETGDFTGWMVETGGAGSWFINDGTIVPYGPFGEFIGTAPPISGNYDAITIQDEPHESVLYQQVVTLPTNISSATLSWSDRIFNFCEDGFIPGEQHFRVWIYDGTEEHTIFFPQPGDPPIQEGPNNRTFDVTSLLQSNEGQEMYIVFEIIVDCVYMNIMVDDVSLDIDTVLPVAIDIKPGSEPNCFNNNGNGVIPVAILGSADFDVTTIDAGSVMLEGLSVKAVGKSNKLLAHYEDVNSDGYNDLVVQIEDTDQVFEEGDTTATVTGNLNNGMPIEGSDSICIVP